MRSISCFIMGKDQLSLLAQSCLPATAAELRVYYIALHVSHLHGLHHPFPKPAAILPIIIIIVIIISAKPRMPS